MSSVFTADDLLLSIAAILGVVAFLMLIRAMFLSQRASRAAYYSTRRMGRDTANHTLVTAATLALIAIGSLITSLLYPDQKPAAPPIIAPSTSTTTTPVVLIVNIVPTSSATPLPATATPQSTPTPLPTVPLARLATKAPTPSSDRNLTLRGISSQIDTLGLPISPTAEFTRGVTAIYVVFDYASVPNNTLLRHTWYRNGNSVHFDSLTWTREGSGNAYVVWLPEGEMEEGLYEVRVMLGILRQFSANFMVR